MFYVRDVTKWFPGEDRHAIQNVIKELIDEEVLRYWSSGSTTYRHAGGILPEGRRDMCSQ